SPDKDTRRRVPVAEIVAAGETSDQALTVLRQFSQPGERLVTLSGEGAAVTAEVTHEALFRHWSLLREWLDSGREDMIFHRRLAEDAAAWNGQKRPKGALWRSPNLDRLREFRRRAEADMNDVQIAFHDAAERQRRWEWMAWRAVAVVVAVLMVAALGAAGLAERQTRIAEEQARIAEEQARIAGEQKQNAEKQTEVAEIQKKNAEEQRKEADAALTRMLRTQSLFVAAQARQRAERGDGATAIGLALEALPRDMAAPDRPYVAEAEAVLYHAVISNRELAVFTAPAGQGRLIAISPDGRRAVLAFQNNNARLWDLDNNTPGPVLTGHTRGVSSAAFSPDGRRVVTAAWDETARLWDAASGAAGPVLTGHTDSVWS
ncbi:MAG: hypothetical protein K2Q10_06120, partial [Rhodospirillales bacterium]|nr:hypothetical protein [Rhodospirillales bacterium]